MYSKQNCYDSSVKAIITRCKMSIANNAVDFMLSHKTQLNEIAQKLAAEPELAWEEKAAHKCLTDALEKFGFTVERQVLDMNTCFKATFGDSGPTVGLFCEYDALPGIDGKVRHACGHQLIAASGVAAAIGIKNAIEARGSGKVVLYGSAAEEADGAKVDFADAGELPHVIHK